MAGYSVSKEKNSKSLIRTCKLLDSITDKYTVFFGTMLGLHREGDVIDGDDDCDFLVPSSLYNNIKELLISCGYEITYYDVKDHFTQFKSKIGETDVLVDFYYYFDYDEEFILDKWNFYGELNNKEKWMLIPKKYLFDFQKIKYKGALISMPKDPEQLCQYLYGERYREKLIKYVEYTTNMVNNKPQTIYNT
jgi:hypothetical protein